MPEDIPPWFKEGFAGGVKQAAELTKNAPQTPIGVDMGSVADTAVGKIAESAPGSEIISGTVEKEAASQNSLPLQIDKIFTVGYKLDAEAKKITREEFGLAALAAAFLGSVSYLLEWFNNIPNIFSGRPTGNYLAKDAAREGARAAARTLRVPSDSRDVYRGLAVAITGKNSDENHVFHADVCGQHDGMINNAEISFYDVDLVKDMSSVTCGKRGSTDITSVYKPTIFKIFQKKTYPYEAGDGDLTGQEIVQNMYIGKESVLRKGRQIKLNYWELDSVISIG